MTPRRLGVLGGAGLALVLLGAVVWHFARDSVLNGLPTPWRIALSARRHGVAVDHGVVITARDGTALTASLYRPAHDAGPLPTVLIQLPYGRLRYGEGFNSALFFAQHGYAVLVEDMRGSGGSQGELLPWKHVAEDGQDTLAWIAAQPWSTGKVGTFGCSALGESQLVLGVKNHPAHAAIIASGAGGAVGSAAGRYAYFGLFEGGVFQLASGFGWFVDFGAKSPAAAPPIPFDRAERLRQLPVASLVQQVRPAPNGYEDYLATPLGDPRWRDWGFLSDADVSRVPSLVINTWGDQTLGDALALAEAWRRRGVPQKVVIAPGVHCQHEEAGTTTQRFGELEIANAQRPWHEWYLRWFDRHLRGRGEGLDDLMPYTYFMLGENLWRGSSQWPPAESTPLRWYLDSAGLANGASGGGHLAVVPPGATRQDEFVYDPANPVPSRGGPVCCTGDPADRPGPADQRSIESRDDVLVYTSAPLDEPLRIAGRVHARLWFSSSALDTDLVARLVDVWPDGRAVGLQEGALRLRYRDGFEKPRLLAPGQVVEVDVDMRDIAYMVPRGHRIRLHVTSSSFPRLERNLNTGDVNNAQGRAMVSARNRIHHGPDSASFLELDVLR